MQFKKLIKEELKEIKALFNDGMAIYGLDEMLSLLEDRYNNNGLKAQFNNALKDNYIFKDRDYWYYYDNVDHINDMDHYIFSDFLYSLKDELKELKKQVKGVEQY